MSDFLPDEALLPPGPLEAPEPLRKNRRNVTGTAEGETLTGTNSSDTFNGRGGADVFEGLLGNDIYRLNANNAGRSTIIDTGGGNDRLILAGAELITEGYLSDFVGYLREGTNLVIDLDRDNQYNNPRNGGDLTIENFFTNSGGKGSGFVEQVDNLTGERILNTSALLRQGNDNNNRLKGGLRNDILDGGAGNDNLKGLNGDDRLVGGDGNDTLVGGNGKDELVGDGGNDKLSGGNGDDALLGRAGNDDLDGGRGNDLLNGHEGNDTLTGGGGRDLLQGGTGNDTYELNANNAGGSSIIDTNGNNDRLNLSGARLSLGLRRGKVGVERNGTSLAIDLDQNGRYNANRDLTIEDFFAEGTRAKGDGFIERVGNLSGNAIFRASPVYYEFKFENTGGDAGVGYVSGIVALPGSVLTNNKPNRKVKALSLKVTEGKNFAESGFIPSLEDVNWAEFTELESEIRGEPVSGSNEFRVNNEGEITFANFRSSLVRANRQVGKYVDSLSIRFGDQGTEDLLANLSSLDNDQSPGSEGCATPSDNGDCAFDAFSKTVTFERV